MLFFIQPHVLDRLIQGKFVAKRQQNKAYQIRDRRNMVSPLNVTRRAIRYEPLVFSNQKPLIIETAQALNNPEKKLFLLQAPSGMGKTAFIRTLVEMMGGGKEQLLWFDVSRHTDFDEVIRFLIDYMTELCMTMGNATPEEEAENPIAHLTHLLEQAQDFPILIVIDNVEFLVAPGQTIRSRELKDAFNFLLSFPNVKLILSGKQLPYADMNPHAKPVYNIQLETLDPTHAIALVQEKLKNPTAFEQDVSTLIPHMKGLPALLELFARQWEQNPDHAFWQTHFETTADSPQTALLSNLLAGLSDTNRLALHILVQIRHGLSPSGVEQILAYCHSNLQGFLFTQLEQSAVMGVLKKNYPPQWVLNHLKTRDKTHKLEAFYQISSLFLDSLKAQLNDDILLWQTHERLSAFYLAEKEKHVLARVVPIRTRHLTAEAQYHTKQLQHRHRPLELREAFTTEADSPMANYALNHSEDAITMPKRYDYGLEENEKAVIPQPLVSSPVISSPIIQAESILQPLLQPILQPVIQPQATVRLSPEDLTALASLITQQRPSSSVVQAKTVYPSEQTTPAIEDAVPPLPALPDAVDVNSPVDETDKALQAALQKALQNQDSKALGQGFLALGQHRIKTGLLNSAEACLIQALAFAQVSDEIALEIEAHWALAQLYHQQYHHNQSLTHLHAILAAPDNTAKQAIYKDVLCLQGDIAMFRSQVEVAEGYYQKALSLCTPKEEAFTDIHHQLALALDEAGQTDAAFHAYRKAYQASQVQGRFATSAAILYNWGSLAFETHHYQAAIKRLKAAFLFDQKAGDLRPGFRTAMRLSKVYESISDLQQSQKWAEKAYQVAKTYHQAAWLGQACFRLARLLESQDAWQEALSYYQLAHQTAYDTLSDESRHWIEEKLSWIQHKLA